CAPTLRLRRRSAPDSVFWKNACVCCGPMAEAEGPADGRPRPPVRRHIVDFVSWRQACARMSTQAHGGHCPAAGPPGARPLPPQRRGTTDAGDWAEIETRDGI